MNALMSVSNALPRPYLLFLGDTTVPGFAKTAFGLKDWAPDFCVGEFALPGATVTTGLPRLSPRAAYQLGARSLVIGVASVGGAVSESWNDALIEALEAGLDIVSGMHTRLSSLPVLEAAVLRTGQRFIEVRQPPANLPVGTGRRRTGKRLLTVGTDCALGKKYTALALTRAFQERGLSTDFRATGQTGIMIAGSGIPMDAVISDFLAGAAEILSPDAAPDHWDVIEGQGSLLHPAYAGVSLGLLHGSQPDVIVVCHEPGRIDMLGTANYTLPTLSETIEINLRLARRTNSAARCGGISLNTSALDADQTSAAIEAAERETGLPAADPMKAGGALDRLVSSCLN